MAQIRAGGRAIGFGLRGLVALVFIIDAAACLSGSARTASDLQLVGIDASLLRPIGLIMLVCALVYAMPSTAFIGAVLVSGFLGGAILAHLRLLEFGSEAQIVCLLLGFATWGGLWQTDPRVRGLLPLRRSTPSQVDASA